METSSKEDTKFELLLAQSSYWALNMIYKGKWHWPSHRISEEDSFIQRQKKKRKERKQQKISNLVSLCIPWKLFTLKKKLYCFLFFFIPYILSLQPYLLIAIDMHFFHSDIYSNLKHVLNLTKCIENYPDNLKKVNRSA